MVDLGQKKVNISLPFFMTQIGVAIFLSLNKTHNLTCEQVIYLSYIRFDNIKSHKRKLRGKKIPLSREINVEKMGLEPTTFTLPA